MPLVVGLLLGVLFGALVDGCFDISDERLGLFGLFANIADVRVGFARLHELRHASQVLRPLA